MNKPENTSAFVQKDYSKATLSALDVSVFTVELATKTIVSVNKRMCEDIEKSAEELLGQPYNLVLWDEFTAVLDELIARAEFGRPRNSTYYWPLRAQWGQVGVRKIQHPTLGSLAVISVTNVTKVSRMEQEYRRMAFFDQQLDIPNGLQLEHDVDMLKSVERVALVHFDIDRFSTINDVYGWDTGDFLLLQIRDWMLKTAVPGCKLYRVSEDEFAMMIVDVSLEDAKKRAQQVLKRFTKPWEAFRQNGLPLYCTITIGVVYGKYLRGDIRNQLFRTINAAGKTGGVFLYDEKMDRLYKEKLLLRQNLINSVQQNMLGFSLRYQPIIDAKTLRWSGVETLCRWNAPNGTAVSPTLFIKELEQLGLIPQLDNWVLETALRECQAHGLGNEDFILDVNLSSLHLLDDAYVKNLLNTLKRYNLPCHKLSLEITESSRFNFSSGSMQYLQKLADEGVNIALDDFGTGYSSFDNLMKLPASTLKTEQSFIENLETDPYLQYLLQAMINIAHTAKMAVIAEGVETEGQKELLTSYGVDCMQGYLFGKPMQISELAKHLPKFRK
ncbi:EAL domain-containing protein [Ruminococcaceae bacterium OttesenSCG-928-A16]|nr:EAL domain-containing protein [Ruminococcaceae bacterium OttesenSCG-928-A16]